MRFILFSILAFATTSAFAQFALVTDKDGYVNIRSSAQLANNIQDTLQNGRLVYLHEREGSFYYTDYYKKNENRNGFVYHDRIKKVTDYEKIPLVSGPANTEIFSSGTIKIIFTRQRFDRSRHKLSFYKEAPDQVEKINGKPYWGTDGGVPTMEYRSIQVQIGQQTVTLPASATDNLFEPGSGNTKVFYDRTKNIIYLQSANSDGAGYYEVIWRVEKGLYKDRFVVSGF
jgi:hypothetical protein